MADTKTSALPVAGALSGAELTAVVQGGANKKTNLNAIAALAGNAAAVQAALDDHKANNGPVHGIADTSLLVDSPNNTLLHFEELTAAAFAALGGVYAPKTFYVIVG